MCYDNRHSGEDRGREKSTTLSDIEFSLLIQLTEMFLQFVMITIGQARRDRKRETDRDVVPGLHEDRVKVCQPLHLEGDV